MSTNGARVLSKPGAPLLRLRGTARSSSVSVVPGRARGPRLVLGLRGRPRCIRRGRLTLRLRPPRGHRLRVAYVYANRRRVRRLRGRSLRRPVRLRRLAGRAVRIRVAAHTRTGHKLVARSSYRRCR